MLNKIKVIENSLSKSLLSQTKTLQARLTAIQNNPILKDSERLLYRYNLKLDMTTDNFNDAMAQKLQDIQNRFEKSVIKLDALSPLSTLSRGYAAVYKDGNIVNNLDTASVGDNISVRLKDTVAECKIERLEKTKW